MGRPTKLERYGRIRDQLAELIADVSDPPPRRATAVALIHHKVPGVSWTGFYMLRAGKLTVDVYQGPLACISLAPHTGVCWAAVDRGEPVVVPDVRAFPDHIACDERSRSEIVVPHFGPDGAVIGCLDLDSHRPDHFGEEDAEGLARVLRAVEGSTRDG